MSDFSPRPCTLGGHLIRLEPLTAQHASALFAAAAGARGWQFLPEGAPFTDLRASEQWIADAQQMASTGWELPFAVIDIASEQAIGSLRYLDIRPEDRALEIGYGWFAAPFQGGAAELEAHRLLLEHAFESLDAVRVQYLFDARHTRAQRLCERLGTRREGLLRKHRITASGYSRDSLVYSLLDSEWAAVKARLDELLARTRSHA